WAGAGSVAAMHAQRAMSRARRSPESLASTNTIETSPPWDTILVVVQRSGCGSTRQPQQSWRRWHCFDPISCANRAKLALDVDRSKSAGTIAGPSKSPHAEAEGYSMRVNAFMRLALAFAAMIVPVSFVVAALPTLTETPEGSFLVGQLLIAS